MSTTRITQFLKLGNDTFIRLVASPAGVPFADYVNAADSTCAVSLQIIPDMNCTNPVLMMSEFISDCGAYLAPYICELTDSTPASLIQCINSAWLRKNQDNCPESKTALTKNTIIILLLGGGLVVGSSIGLLNKLYRWYCGAAEPAVNNQQAPNAHHQVQIEMDNVSEPRPHGP